MKTYKNLYNKLCSSENIYLAYRKARKGKTKKESVIEFEKNLWENLKNLQQELEELNYQPFPLKRFVIHDQKTRTIHASMFKDRIVHHVLINVLEPIFEKIFICDSYASRKNKGTHNALQRFDYFKRKVSQNGLLIHGKKNKNQIQGYCLKIDIKHYFDTVNHNILINIIKRKIKDPKIIWLIWQILKNLDSKIKGSGMPLGNFTSQFFANVYLNELDYFVKHKLKVKYYLRYVDDFVILHRSKKRLEYFREEINCFLRSLKIEIHPDKSRIVPLQKGISFLGYRIFYNYKLLKKRNLKEFLIKFDKLLLKYKNNEINKENFTKRLQGWVGYSQWANTYRLRQLLKKRIEEIFRNNVSEYK